MGTKKRPCTDTRIAQGESLSSSSARPPDNDELAQSTIALPALRSPLDPYQPHDKLVKCAFANKEIADDFFDANLGFYKTLSKEERAGFLPSDNEYQKAYQSKELSDVIYCGKIGGQVYYIDVEHQSRDDATMPLRTYKYHKSLVDIHLEQKGKGLPVTIFICLYHNPNNNKSWESDITLGSCFVEGHAINSFLGVDIEPFKLIDLTTMKDDKIMEHGKAAILCFALRDAYKRDSRAGIEEYFSYMIENIKKQGYNELGSFFMDALIEYIAYICKGVNSLRAIQEVVSELLTAMPDLPEEEKFSMKTIENRLLKDFEVTRGKQLIQQGVQQGRQEVTQFLIKHGVDLAAIGLTDEVLAQFSLDKSGSSSSSQALQGTANVELLEQRMSGTPESAVSGAMTIAPASNPELVPIAHMDKKFGRDRG